jgi:hypothetical protein
MIRTFTTSRELHFGELNRRMPMGMNARQLVTHIVTGEILAAIRDDLHKRKVKTPMFLLAYSYIDICASLACDPDLRRSNGSTATNGDRFEWFVANFAGLGEKPFSTYDLWAARSSLLHTLSPFGNHTAKVSGSPSEFGDHGKKRGSAPAKPIFYYTDPASQVRMQTALTSRGFTDVWLIEADVIYWLACDVGNFLSSKINEDPIFASRVEENARALLKDANYFALEEELLCIEAASGDARRN